MKLRHAVELDAVDHLIHKPLAGGVHNTHAGEVLHQGASHRVHQVGLAHPHASVDEQRIVGAGRRCCHGLSGGVRKLITGTDHEVVEVELSVDLTAGALEQGRVHGSVSLRVS